MILSASTRFASFERRRAIWKNSSWLKTTYLGADFKICAPKPGSSALRERFLSNLHQDFRSAKDKVLYKKKENVPDGDVLVKGQTNGCRRKKKKKKTEQRER